MANVLKMMMVEAIHSLRSAGLSCREIARRLGIHRETVSRHLRLGGEPVLKPASAPIFPAGSEAGVAGFGAPPGPGVAGFEPPTGSPRSQASVASPWLAWLLEQRERGLSAKRIHQDPLIEYSAAAEVSYDSVRRLFKKHGAAPPVPFRRTEGPPEFEAHVDFSSSKASAVTMARPCSPRSRERHGTRARSSGASIPCSRTPSRGGRSPASTPRTSISRSGRVVQPTPGFTGPRRSRCWPPSTKRNGQPSYRNHRSVSTTSARPCERSAAMAMSRSPRRSTRCPGHRRPSGGAGPPLAHQEAHLRGARTSMRNSPR